MSDSFLLLVLLVLLRITQFVDFVFTGLIKVKSRGLEEIPVFDISEKTINGLEKSLSSDEERLVSGIF